MDFQQGVFERFKTTSTIHLGAYQTNLPEGVVVEFDGITLKFGGESYNVPAMKGAVTAKWLVPVSDNVSRYVPKPAGVKVRPAQPTKDSDPQGMTVEVSSDEQEVIGDYKQVMDARRASASQAAMTTPAPQAAPMAPPPKSQAIITPSEEPPVEVEYDLPSKTSGGMEVVHEQEGVPVARVFSPAVKKTVLTSVSQAEQATRDLDGVNGRPARVAQKVAHAIPGINERGPGGASGDVSETKVGDSLEDILPDAATAAPPAEKFDWDKSVHWRKRVGKALEYADKPDILKQILAVEAPSVVGYIKSEMARKGLPFPA